MVPFQLGNSRRLQCTAIWSRSQLSGVFFCVVISRIIMCDFQVLLDTTWDDETSRYVYEYV